MTERIDPVVEKRLLDLGVSRESFTRLGLYVDILLRWQTRLNLIGPATIKDVWTRHILDSVQLLPYLPEQNAPIAELGSGAGIPGLVVAIVSQRQVHLFESNTKKCAFLREAARVTSTRADIHNIRLETLTSASAIPEVGCVVARALAPLKTLLTYAEPFLIRGATGLFHKGQDVDSELTEATKYWKIKFERHQSMVESESVILEVKEAIHV